MQILLNSDGYVESYALVGEITDGIDVPAPTDIAHFEEHYYVYHLKNKALKYDSKQNEILEKNIADNDYCQLREAQCFSYINRGTLWYETLTDLQMAELRTWYKAWLDGTQTLTVPEKPSWLK